MLATDDQDENGKDRVNPLFVQKYKLKPGETTLTITIRVKGEPAKAGIDRIHDDNTISVALE